MELSLRTVLVILGSLFMLGILVDGFRRMRRARQEALKLDVQGNFQFPDEGFSSELPNGGARVISEHAKSELLEEAYAFKDQLDDLPGLSALEEIDTKADEEEESPKAEGILNKAFRRTARRTRAPIVRALFVCRCRAGCACLWSGCACN